MIPATVSKINRGIFGTGVTGSSTGELLGKVKKLSMKDLITNSKGANTNDKNRNKSGDSTKNEDTDEDTDGNENSAKNNRPLDPGPDIPDSKPLSLFSNLFSNKKNMTENSENKNQTDNKTKTPKSKYAENDDSNSDNEKNPNSAVAKRKYTQFGYFAHRPSCTADSDFLTVIVSGIEVHDLFYVDRLWSPQPYLELAVGTYVRSYLHRKIQQPKIIFFHV